MVEMAGLDVRNPALQVLPKKCSKNKTVASTESLQNTKKASLFQVHEGGHPSSVHGNDTGPVNCYLGTESIMNMALRCHNMT